MSVKASNEQSIGFSELRPLSSSIPKIYEKQLTFGAFPERGEYDRNVDFRPDTGFYQKLTSAFIIRDGKVVGHRFRKNIDALEKRMHEFSLHSFSLDERGRRVRRRVNLSKWAVDYRVAELSYFKDVPVFKRIDEINSKQNCPMCIAVERSPRYIGKILGYHATGSAAGNIIIWLLSHEPMDHDLIVRKFQAKGLSAYHHAASLMYHCNHVHVCMGITTIPILGVKVTGHAVVNRGLYAVSKNLEAFYGMGSRYRRFFDVPLPIRLFYDRCNEEGKEIFLTYCVHAFYCGKLFNNVEDAINFTQIEYPKAWDMCKTHVLKGWLVISEYSYSVIRTMGFQIPFFVKKLVTIEE
jgi:hypothetical protein